MPCDEHRSDRWHERDPSSDLSVNSPGPVIAYAAEEDDVVAGKNSEGNTQIQFFAGAAGLVDAWSIAGWHSKAAVPRATTEGPRL
jgi:hypothetical protein